MKYSDNVIYVYATIQSLREFNEMGETFSMKGKVFVLRFIVSTFKIYPRKYPFLA
jgi:hypothetical protein